jgi:hypothetical protein
MDYIWLNYIGNTGDTWGFNGSSPTTMGNIMEILSGD